MALITSRLGKVEERLALNTTKKPILLVREYEGRLYLEKPDGSSGSAKYREISEAELDRIGENYSLVVKIHSYSDPSEHHPC